MDLARGVKQFGVAIARLPRKCVVMWLGDHRQTPGGLRKSESARLFRQKAAQTASRSSRGHYPLPA